MKKLSFITCFAFVVLLGMYTDCWAPPPSLPPLQIQETDGSPKGTALKIVVTNDSLSDSGGGTWALTTGGVGGQAITLDLGDDSGDDSTDLGEIATESTTCGSIFTLDDVDKLLIDCSVDWPNATTATTAGAGDDATSFFPSGTIEAARLPTCSGSTAGIMPTTSGVTDGWVMTVQGDESVAWEAPSAAGSTTLDALTDTGISSPASGHLLLWDGSDSWDNKAMSGAGTITNEGVFALNGTAVGDTNIADGAVDGGTGGEIADDSITAADLAATLTFADGDFIDLSGITHTGSADEGIALPAWADVTPANDKPFIAWDTATSAIKVYDGGWVALGATAAPVDATYLTLGTNGTLTAERVLTAGEGVDFTDGGANGLLTILGEDSSATNNGIVELATDAEANAGTCNPWKFTSLYRRNYNYNSWYGWHRNMARNSSCKHIWWDRTKYIQLDRCSAYHFWNVGTIGCWHR